jgi:hypothetical protein
MNKFYVSFHLKEAQEAIQQLIVDLEQNPDYDDVEFRIDIAHLYNHINTAWNARDVADEETSELTDDLFYQWRAFPTDIDMSK